MHQRALGSTTDGICPVGGGSRPFGRCIQIASSLRRRQWSGSQVLLQMVLPVLVNAT